MSETAHDTMTAIAVEGGKGPAEALHPVRIARPEPGPGQLLIKVRAAGINRPDILQRLGGYPPPPGSPASSFGRHRAICPTTKALPSTSRGGRERVAERELDHIWQEHRDLRHTVDALGRSLDAYSSLQAQLAGELEQLRKAVRSLRSIVDAMTKADEIADVVARRVREERLFGWTLAQKLAVALVGAVGLAGTLHGLGAW